MSILSLNKDKTRPTNESYGLNWGYRADNAIEQSINTGDIAFFDYRCDKWLYPSDVVKCYSNKLRNKEEFSNCGFFFKTPLALFVVFSNFGRLTIMPYNEFLNRPYIVRIKWRNLENPPVDIIKKSMDFVTHIKGIKDSHQTQEKSGRHANKAEEAFKEKQLMLHINQIVGLYYQNLGMLRVNPISSYLSAKDFDIEHPFVFFKGYSFGPAYILRSETSKCLKDNMNFK